MRTPPSGRYPRRRPARVGRGTLTAPGPETTRVVQPSKHRPDAGLKPSALWGTYQTSHDTRCRVDTNDEARWSKARRRRAEPDLAREARCDGAEHSERTAAERRAARRGEGAEVLRVAVADAVEFSGAPG